MRENMMQANTQAGGAISFDRALKVLANNPTCQRCRKKAAAFVANDPIAGRVVSLCRDCNDLASRVMRTQSIPAPRPASRASLAALEARLGIR